MYNGGFKQKLSARTQIALHRLLADIHEVCVDNDPDSAVRWTGDFVLAYSDERRYPRLIVCMQHDGTSTFTQWWTDDPDQGLTADEDLAVLVQG